VAHPKIAIRNARIPGRDGASDILIDAGRILDVLAHDPAAAFEGAEICDAGGHFALPGMTDAHVHLREPGFEWKETIATGLQAAQNGGFSNVMCMANTDPVNDEGPVTRFMLDKAAASGAKTRLFPIGALTVGLSGKQLAPMAELAEAGCRAFSNDGRPVADTELFRRAVEYASDLGLAVIDHCEEPGMAPAAGINEGAVSARLGLKGQPDIAEAIQAARDVLLADYLGAHVHLAHISCRRSVEIIAAAKARGVSVTAETCPHYLVFTEDEALDYRTSAKVNPPLRTRDDVEALRQAVRAGVIDILATDHAPHAAHEKETPFDQAPCGISGLDTALSLTFSLADKGVLSMEDIVRLWCERPADIFSLPVNRFQPGDPADVFVFDPSASWTVSAQTMLSKSKNTPCLGMTLPGRITAGFIAGERVK